MPSDLAKCFVEVSSGSGWRTLASTSSVEHHPDPHVRSEADSGFRPGCAYLKGPTMELVPAGLIAQRLPFSYFPPGDKLGLTPIGPYFRP
jgi:hypothetical protein